MKCWSVAFAFLILSTGCDGGSAAPDSSIELPDAGPADAGADGGSDAGQSDAGPYCGSTRGGTTDFPPLPPSCLPRCSAETFEAAAACADVTCQNAAFRMDTTPSVVVDTPYGDVVVGCGAGTDYPCTLWQQLSCDAEVCPDEYYAWWMGCAGPRSRCPELWDALDACRQAGSEWTTCFTARAAECFEH